MKPVDGAAIDEGGKHSQSIPECIPYWAHGKSYVEVLFHPFSEVVIQRQRICIQLFALRSINYLMTE